MKKPGIHSPERVERHLLRRIVTYIIGLFLAALSANLSIMANLGVSAFNSSCLIFSSVTAWDFGTWLIAINLSIMVAEIILLGRDFQLINVAQVPFVLIYGKFVTLVSHLLPDVVMTKLYFQIPLLLLSVLLLALGILIYVGTELVSMPVEGFCLALASKLKFQFHNVKTGSDCFFLLSAIAASFLLFGRLEAVGLGTVILAFGTGPPWALSSLCSPAPCKTGI